MELFSEKQKTKILSSSGLDNLDVDCFISKVFSNKLIISVLPMQKVDFSEFSEGYNLEVKIYTPNGIAIFTSNVSKKISSKEIEIIYDKNDIKIENIRQNPRYQANCPLTVFRPLRGNVEGHLIDISVRGLRFFSNTPLEVDSTFEIMLSLSDTIGKIIFTGKILDKTGLPEGVHRMLIEEISYLDRQKLTDFCMSLAK